MKKIVTFLMFLTIMINVTFAYTLTVNDFTTDVGEGRKVTSIANSAYTFLNWTGTGIELTDAVQKNPKLEFRMPANDVTITAHYKETELKKYQIFFNSNNGQGNMPSVEFTQDTPKNLPANKFSKNGYKFAGWSESLGGSVMYTDGQLYTATKSMTLYAVWSTDAYTIEYLNVENNPGNPSTYNVTDNITLKNPIKAGYNFIGWTGTGLAGRTMTVTIPSGSIGDRKYTANWELKTYTLTFYSNGGTTVSKTQTFKHGVAQKLSPNTFIKDGYVFKGWSITQNGKVAFYDQENYTVTANVNLYAVWEIFKWNAPKIKNGLTPVNWNDGKKDWETTTLENWKYNYEIATANHGTVAGDGTGQWANAKTNDGSMYVWIPRYSYKIEKGYHNIGNSWSNTSAPGNNKIVVKFSQGIKDKTNGYIPHPAFTFGNTEVEGIWVAKYEASRNDATEESDGKGNIPTFKPIKRSWGGLPINDMFQTVYNLNRELDSHLMKNSEWGAVAYLTNAIGKIPYINNNIYGVTGCAAPSQDYQNYPTSDAWNTAGGVKASTTHNVYGIFDMSGGLGELTAAYVNNNDPKLINGGSNLIASYNQYGTKYVNIYPHGSPENLNNNYMAWENIKGDAIFETSNSPESADAAWDSDLGRVPGGDCPFFYRGGKYSAKGNAGIFYFYCALPDGNSDQGFRAVLCIK